MKEELSTQSRTGIPYLKDTIRISSQVYKSSREESSLVWNLYHNRQYTAKQRNILHTRGQPKETFNLVKLFARLLVGYYSTMVNQIGTTPVGPEDQITSSLISDAIDHSLRDNNFFEEGEKIKLSGLISGLMVAYVNVVPTGNVDDYGRPINKIYLEHVPEHEILIDPMSTREDYTDARFIHRQKWISEEAVIQLFGAQWLKKLQEYYNYSGVDDADFEDSNTDAYAGIFRKHNNYLVTHSIIVDDKNKSWSIYWHDETIIKKEEITHKEVKFPYRIVKVHTSDQKEYYGIFREVIETQFAMNQALIKFQQLSNSQKIFAQKNAVESMADFVTACNKTTGVIPVLNLKGIQVEDLNREAMEQYTIIDKGFDRVQKLLGINDSFMGDAYASDSGRKVKLQQNASSIALRYFTSKVETFYRFLGWDIANLIKQYFTAHQVLRIADQQTGFRWAEINKPMTKLVIDPNTDQPLLDEATGEPMRELLLEQVFDPGSGDPLVNELGQFIVAPVPTEESEIAFTNVDIEVTSSAYNDEDEKNQLMLETVLNGGAGQLMAQVNPSGYFRMHSLSVQSYKTKNAPEVSKIFEETANMLGSDPEAQQNASNMAQANGGGGRSPMSSEMKLPQNTNEGL